MEKLNRLAFVQKEESLQRAMIFASQVGSLLKGRIVGQTGRSKRDPGHDLRPWEELEEKDWDAMKSSFEALCD